jgi:glyoxylase-like metal-dependent hydrolase (beta-lactamase superfamily II)
MLDQVRLLSAGFCSHPEAMTRRGAPWRPHRFPSGFTLIVHRRRGAILFDTGYAARFLRATRALPNAIYRWLTPVAIDDAQTAVAQLAALGIAARDVTHVVVSHFHADHIGALRDFPAARIVSSRAAWDSVRGRRGIGALRRAFLPELIPPDAETRMLFTGDCAALPLENALAPFGDGRDLFGDGSLVAVDLPGHAHGQIGLLLRDAPGGPLFLIADAAWSHEAYERNVPPPWITTAVLGETRAYRATLHALFRLHRAEPALRLVPAHDAPR